MAAPSVTYTFTNGAGNTIDATQVNANFTDITNGFSDTTKDFSMNDGTLGGDLTVTGDILTTALSDYSATTTLGGFASTTIKEIWYKQTGKTVHCWFEIKGTSDTAAFTFTLPTANNSNVKLYAASVEVFDNTVQLTVGGQITMATGSATVTLGKDQGSSTGWTGSGTKAAAGSFSYEID